MMIYLILVLSEVACLKFLEYRFGENYGIRFFDFSGNNRHGTGEGSGVISTDRGIYLDGGQNKVKIPSFNFYSSTLFFWVMPKGDTGVIFTHKYSSKDSFLFYRKDTAIALTKNGKIEDKKTSDPGILADNSWVLIKFRLKPGKPGKDGKYEIEIARKETTENLKISINIKVGYQNSISLGAYDSKNPSTKIFIWYFAIHSNDISFQTYYSITPGYCLSENCSICSYYFIDPKYGKICLSTSSEQYKNSKGIDCPSTFGCSSNFTFNCSCPDYCLYDFITNTTNCQLNSTENIICNSSLVLRGSTCCNQICDSCESNNSCLSCIDPHAVPLNDTFGLAASNEFCRCADGFWGSASNTTTTGCLPCPLGCLNCKNNSFCTECIDENSSLFNNICQCNPGFFNEFPEINLTCSPCLFGCKNCKNFDICEICFESLSLIDKRCSCKVGTFLEAYDFMSYNCSDCLSNCIDCSSLLFCKTCKDPYSRSEGGSCVCINMFYGQANENQPCRAQCGVACAACASPNECTRCIDQNAIISNKKCVCQTGFYLDSTDKITCLQCGYGCFECSKRGYCEKCYDVNAETSQFVCKCKDGYYEIPNNSGISSEMKCARCHFTCLTCNDFKYCTACYGEYQEPVNGTCQCKEKFYNDSLTHVCKSCHHDCSICENSLQCIECNAINSQVEVYQGCSCLNGFFNESRLSTRDSCLKCQYRCKICQKYDFCLSCIGKNTQIINGFCECLPGYYFNDNESLECIPCITFTEAKSCRLDCGKGKAWYKLQCVPCLEFCLECDDSLSCLKCVEGMKVTNGNCTCLKAQKLENKICTTQYFSLNVATLSNNSLSLTSDQELESDLSSQSIKLYVSGESKGIHITKINNIYYHINFQKSQFFNISTPYTLSLAGPIYSNNNSVLIQYDYFGEFTPSPTTPFAKAVKSAMKGALSSSFAGAMISNPASCWILLNTIQIVIYLPLSPIEYSARILEFIQSLAGYSIIPNIMEFLFDTETSSKPIDRVQRVGLTSSVFWINIGPSLIILLFYLAIFPFVLIGSKLPFVSNFCLEMLKNYRYNIFLRFWIEVYLEAGLFSLIQIQSTIHSKDIGYFNFMIATLTFGLVIATPAYAVYLFYSLRNKTSDLDVIERYGSVYCEFKLDKGFYSQLFYLMYIIRRFQFILTQCLLTDHVYLQYSLNLIFSIIQFLYIAYYRPFKERHIMFSEFIGEACVIIVIVISGFMLPSQKNFNQESIDKVFYAVVLTCVALQTALSMFSVYLMVKENFKKWKKYKLEKIIKKSQKVYPERTQTTFGEHNDQKIESPEKTGLD